MVVRVEYDRSNKYMYVCIRIGDRPRSSHAVAHRRVGSSLTLVQQIPLPLLPSLSSSPSILLLPFPLPFPFRPSSLCLPLEVGGPLK